MRVARQTAAPADRDRDRLRRLLDPRPLRRRLRHRLRQEVPPSALYRRYRVTGLMRVRPRLGCERSRDLAITAGNAGNVEVFRLTVPAACAVAPSRASEQISRQGVRTRPAGMVDAAVSAPRRRMRWSLPLFPSSFAYFRPSRPYFAASADRSSQRDPFQSLAKDACGAWRLVGILEPRMARRSSTARPTRAIPPLLPRLRRGYPA